MKAFLVEQKLVLAERKSQANSMSPVQWPAMASICLALTPFVSAVPSSKDNVVTSVNFSDTGLLMYSLGRLNLFLQLELGRACKHFKLVCCA